VRSVVRIYPGPPLKVRGCSSAGRAPALQAGGHRFDPGQLHQPLPSESILEVMGGCLKVGGCPMFAPACRGTTWVERDGAKPLPLFPTTHHLNCSKLSIPKRMLTFGQRRKAICSNPPQGGHRIKPRCNWMFDNEIDWVKKYKAEQAFS
jgi:hypothetical protein